MARCWKNYIEQRQQRPEKQAFKISQRRAETVRYHRLLDTSFSKSAHNCAEILGTLLAALPLPVPSGSPHRPALFITSNARLSLANSKRRSRGLDHSLIFFTAGEDVQRVALGHVLSAATWRKNSGNLTSPAGALETKNQSAIGNGSGLRGRPTSQQEVLDERRIPKSSFP